MFLFIFIFFLHYQCIFASLFTDKWPAGTKGLIADIALTLGTAYTFKKVQEKIKEVNKVDKEEKNLQSNQYGKLDPGFHERGSAKSYELGKRISKTHHMRDLWSTINFSLALLLTVRLLTRIEQNFYHKNQK